MVPLNHKNVRLENLINWNSIFKYRLKSNFSRGLFFVTVFLPTFFRKKVGPRRKGDERI